MRRCVATAAGRIQYEVPAPSEPDRAASRRGSFGRGIAPAGAEPRGRRWHAGRRREAIARYRRPRTLTGFRQPPGQAAWEHRGARRGFEVVFCDEYRFEGGTAAVEGDEAWVVHYRILLDAGWRTQRARVTGHSAGGRRELTLQCDPGGEWTLDGERAPQLEGCLDVDLESSALTNAFPVHRLGLQVGEQA